MAFATLEECMEEAATLSAADRVCADLLSYLDAPDWLHEGQASAWTLDHYRTLAVIAGKQGGKSTFGLPWFFREIQLRGPGHYFVGGPSYVVLNKKALPDLVYHLETSGFAKYNKTLHEFHFTPAGIRAFFGTTDYNELYERYKFTDPDNNVTERRDEFRVEVVIFVVEMSDPKKVEAGTYKAAWVDEGGSTDISEKAFDNLVNGRLVRFRGRCCITTTPYDINWLKFRLYDKCEKAPRAPGLSEFVVGHIPGDIAVVRFESWMNPVFGLIEFGRIKDSGMPDWYFDMMYRGMFTRPVGAIYDVFDEARHTCPMHKIPQDWVRAFGTDFGQINFAAVKVAIDPVRMRAVIYTSYCPGKALDTPDHIRKLMHGEPSEPLIRGGNRGEKNWRQEFQDHGMIILEPLVSSVFAAIQIIYSLLARDRLVIMDGLGELIKEFKTYKWVLDDEGNPTDDIENKAKYHRLDALRSIARDIERALTQIEEEQYERRKTA